jgi:LPXTG-motif cell wall-anchored protein
MCFEVQNKNLEMLIFAIIMVFIFFSNRLDPKISLAITGILLVGIFLFRLKKKKND